MESKNIIWKCWLKIQFSLVTMCNNLPFSFNLMRDKEINCKGFVLFINLALQVTHPLACQGILTSSESKKSKLYNLDISYEKMIGGYFLRKISFSTFLGFPIPV